MVKSDKRLTRTGWSALFSPLRMLMISACCYFISAGRLNIPRGWLYYLLALALSLCANLFLFCRSPELLNERGRMGEGTESRDKILLLLLFGTTLVILPVVAGLDSGRFNGAPLPDFYIYAGVFLQVICSGMVLWAMLENPFFEGTMRLQKDRGQHVVSNGPYRYVRHPGYLGMAVNALPLPLIAGSRVALIPALFAIIVIVVRTALEDQLLLDQLPGHRDYSRKVRYRLLPLIW
ncbi:MAG: methyltransferase family protein [Kiritimatiellia bacterium]